MKSESKTFDTSTVHGLKLAEQYQARLYSKYDRVIVSGGLNYVRIEGRNRANN